MMPDDEAAWWAENCEHARERLAELFAEENTDVPTYRHAQIAAIDLLLNAVPFVVLDPTLDEPPEVWTAIDANITRLVLLARRLYELEPVAEQELDAGRFVTMCFESLGSTSYIALWVARLALTALSTISSAVLYEELLDEPGYDAWCLVTTAYNWLRDIDHAVESDLWVRPNETLIGRGVAHQISNVVTWAGGTDPMSQN